MAAPGTKMMLSLAATLMHNSYALQTSPALVRLLRTQPRVSPATLQVVPAELLQEQLALGKCLGYVSAQGWPSVQRIIPDLADATHLIVLAY